MNTSRFLPPFLAVFAVAAAVSAIDDDPARAEAARLMQQASQAKSEGRYDEARELAEKARRIEGELRERDHRKEEGGSGDRPRDERFANMKREIEELRRQGQYEEADRRTKELKESWAREQRKDGARPDGEGPEKIGHIMEAVRHLHAAGLHEPAEHLEQQARQMKAEFEQRRREQGDRRDGEKGRPPGDSSEVRELRDQVQKLSRELEQMREAIKMQRSQGPKTE